MAALAVIGVSVLLAAALVGVLLRATKVSRRRSGRRSFDGRYTDFGFLFGVVDGSFRTGRTNTGRDDDTGDGDSHRRGRRAG